MNIFCSSPHPHDSAFALDDKRVIKMILESAQIMSTAINLSGGKGPYKTTHKNHPVVVWARKNRSNYWWLFQHYQALYQVYYDRFGKIHKTGDHMLTWSRGAYLLPKGKLTPFVNCTKFKDANNVHIAYQIHLCKKWMEDKRKPKWTKSNPPKWFA
jgi:hypothetical protein